jgi:hypothetical protein
LDVVIFVFFLSECRGGDTHGNEYEEHEALHVKLLRWNEIQRQQRGWRWAATFWSLSRELDAIAGRGFIRMSL